MLADIQSKNKASMDKLDSIKEELKKISTEAGGMRAQQANDAAKLDSALAKIEDLNKKVHESHCEVASLMKKVEISNSYQKLTT